MGRVTLATLLAVLFAIPAARAQNPAEDVVPCDAAMRAEIIDSISAALIQTYIFLDVAEEMERYVRQRRQDGAYDEIATVPQFTQVLTQDLRSISHDRHLSVGYVPPDLMARMTSAPRMPQRSVFCWYAAGTAKKEKIMMKTNMLSMLNDFSMI